MKTMEEISAIIEHALTDTYNDELIQSNYEVAMSDNCHAVEVYIYSNTTYLDGIGEIFKAFDHVCDNLVNVLQG